jgi:hypothetical protein
MKTIQRLSLAAAALCGTLLAVPAQAHGVPLPPDPLQLAVRIGLPLPPLPGLQVHGAPVPRSHPSHVEPAWRDRHGHWHQPAPRSRIDRDRDGVPDWRDHHDNRRDPPAWRHAPDRDRDGIPDWRERRHPYGR